MRVVVIGAAAFLASVSAAFAADDVMAGYYGNTVVSKTAMTESRMHYKADHTFAGKASSLIGSMELKGTWKLDEKGQLCRTYETPPPGVSNPLCTPVEAHKPGDSWTATFGSQSRSLTLLPGVQ